MPIGRRPAAPERRRTCHGLDAHEHVVAEHGVARAQPDEQGVDVGQYAIPPKQQQPGSGHAAPTMMSRRATASTTPRRRRSPASAVGDCCSVAEPAHDEVISRPDSNDTRMQQVMYANGKLWGALDTALNPDGGPQRAGIAWYIVNPARRARSSAGLPGRNRLRLHVSRHRRHAERPRRDGVHGDGRHTQPERRVRSDRRDRRRRARGTSCTGGTGAAQDDGFTSYKSQVGNPPRTRWGDYGAAAVDGNSVWVASEYIAHACNYTDWGGPFFAGGTGDNLLGTCGGASHGPGPRSALANWSTRISKFTP